MSPVGFVFVHGGLSGGWRWDAVRAELSVPSVAVDLPGRGAPVDQLLRVTLEDWVVSAAAQAAELPADRLVLVGHSLGGVTLPGLAAMLRGRVAALVFVAALLPPQGGTVAALLNPEDPEAIFDERGLFPVPSVERVTAMVGLGRLTPREASRYVGRLVPEPPGPFRAVVDRSGMPDVPITYVRGEHDAAVPMGLSARLIRNLGRPVDEVVLPAGHDLVVTHAAELADVLNRVAASVTATTEVFG